MSTAAIEFGQDCAFFPIKFPNLLKFYRKQTEMFWFAPEIDMSQDREDWAALDEPTKRMVKFVLCFFAQADGLVIENITKNFQEQSSAVFKEAGHFYVAQNLIETVHNEVYSVMIDVFITDPVEREQALNAIEHYPSIRKLGLWMKDWMDSDRPLYEQIIAFGCVESIVFVAFFVVIWYVKRRNILGGLCKANEFIARDEALHALFAVELFDTMRKQPGGLGITAAEEAAMATRIIRDAVDIAELLVRKMLAVDLVGLTADDLVEYVKVTADSFSTQLGHKPIYNAESPFEWMAAIGMVNRTNFFEQRVTEYSKLKGGGNFEFCVTADF